MAVTYCPLCNSALTFRRTLDGRVLDYGTTDKLRNSDLVMYDLQTESWWQQFTGEAIVGELTGAELKLVPSRLVSFGQFAAEFPNGRVLVPSSASRSSHEVHAGGLAIRTEPDAVKPRIIVPGQRLELPIFPL